MISTVAASIVMESSSSSRCHGVTQQQAAQRRRQHNKEESDEGGGGTGGGGGGGGGEGSDHRRHNASAIGAHRPIVFDKMEELVREMQDPENGVPVRSQKLFLTSIPSAFMGYDMIEWLMERLNIEDSVEAIHTANLLCQYGYFFPVGECCKNLSVKDDSSLYRFQSPQYWATQNHQPDNIDYAVYLYKRSLRNKQKHGLEDYEMDALNRIKKQFALKWEVIVIQAEEQVRLAKDRKKGDKIVSDSQERAYWRAYRPPPGCLNCLEHPPYRHPNAASTSSRRKWNSINDIKTEVNFLSSQLVRARIKVSAAAETLQQHSATYAEFDPLLCPPQPSNPWLSDDPTYWVLNAPVVEVPTEKRAKRWAISIEDLVADQTGLQELTNYLRKEYSHENIRFWLATNQLRSGPASSIRQRVQEIYFEFLAPGAPCEINIDGRTMDRVQREMKRPSRFTFDRAAEHVYNLLLKKDCYPRFVRSEHYKQLLANALQPSQKKRFFNFGAPGKKKSIVSATVGNMPLVPAGCIQPPQPLQTACGAGGGAVLRRRGSVSTGLPSGPSIGGGSSPSESSVVTALPGALVLATSSATAAVASAGINPVPSSSGTGSASGSIGEECDAPYRGDMPIRISASNILPPLSPPPLLTPVQSRSSCSDELPLASGVVDDVCPWETVPFSASSSSCHRKSSSALESMEQLKKRFLSVMDSSEATGSSPSADLDVCPWESPRISAATTTTAAAASSVGGSDGCISSVPLPPSPPPPPPHLPQSNLNESVLPTTPTNKLSFNSDDIFSRERREAEPLRPLPPNVAPGDASATTNQTTRSSEITTSTSATVSSSSSIVSHRPVIVTSDPSSSSSQKSLQDSSSGSQSQQSDQQAPPTSAAVSTSDICPWEDEESCKLDQPFVKTYATLGYL